MSKFSFKSFVVVQDVFDTSAGPSPVTCDLNDHADARGSFTELWVQKDHKKLVYKYPSLGDFEPRQVNVSHSKPNVFRGLHWQLPPSDMSKYVTCLTGTVIDVVVDIRKNSSTFGKSFAVKLVPSVSTSIDTASTFPTANAIFVPPGFAHGFLATEYSSVLYVYDKYYNPELERNCYPLDPALNLSFIPSNAELSLKDKNASLLEKLGPNDLF